MAEKEGFAFAAAYLCIRRKVVTRGIIKAGGRP